MKLKALILAAVLSVFAPLVSAADKTVCASGCTYSTIQAATAAANPGDRHVVKGNPDGSPLVYQQAGGNSGNFVALTRSGTSTDPIYWEFEPGVVLRGKWNGQQAKNQDRTVVLNVTANWQRVKGLKILRAGRIPLQVSGGSNALEEVRISESWHSGVQLGGSNNTLTYVSIDHTQHGGGLSVAGTNNKFVRSLGHHNGKLPDTDGDPSNDPRVPGNVEGEGDPTGGGNSDGGGASKDCQPSGGANVCQQAEFRQVIAWLNTDDGFDVSFANSKMVNNVSFSNGPEGGAGIKVLREASGNQWVGNVAFKTLGPKASGLQLRSTGGHVVQGNVAIGYPSAVKGISMMGQAQTTNGNRTVTSSSLVPDLYPPAGATVCQEHAFYYNQFRAEAPELPELPACSGTPPPPPVGDFAVAVAPASLTVAPGGQAVYSVGVARTTFADPVTLSVAGLIGTFSPNPVTGAVSTLTVTAPAAVGSYPVMVTGVGGTLTRSDTAALVVEITPSPSPTPDPSGPTVFTIPGYANGATGGTGGRVCDVTSTADTMAVGTLRNCVTASGPRIAVSRLPLGSVVRLTSKLVIPNDDLTVDGRGLGVDGELVSGGSEQETIQNEASNVILSGLRFSRVWKFVSDAEERGSAITRLAVVNCTFESPAANDIAFSLWGAHDLVTFAGNLVYGGGRAISVSHYPNSQLQQRVTIAYNVLVENVERSGQFRGLLRDFEFTNNVVHYTDYGTRIRAEAGAIPYVHLRSNLYLAGGATARAVIYGNDPGASDNGGVRVGLSGNSIPAGTDAATATTAPPALAVGALTSAQIIQVANLRASLLPVVGAPYRTAADSAVIARTAAR